MCCTYCFVFTLNMQNREYVVDCTVFIPRQPKERAKVKAVILHRLERARPPRVTCLPFLI